MKKLVVTMLTVLSCGAAYALPVGNPSEASLMTDGLFWEGSCADICDPCASWCDAFSFRAGFYGDYVYNRHMQFKDDNSIVENTEIYTNAGYLAVNAWNRVDIFATLGITNMYIADNGADWGLADRFFLDTVPEFSWSVGSRITLWECGCTTLGIEGQYFYTNPNIKRINDFYLDDTHKLTYQEWQVGLGISHRINMFVPYAAVKWAQSNLKFNNEHFHTTGDLFKLENQKDWGYAIGVSLIDCEKASLTAEADFASEKALYINGQFRF